MKLDNNWQILLLLKEIRLKFAFLHIVYGERVQGLVA